MDLRPWTLVLARMIAAGGPERIPIRVTWPLHGALRGLHASAGRTGLLGRLDVDWMFEVAPECGLRVVGADDALHQLIETGLLRRVGAGAGAALEVDAEQLVAQRRALMLLDPELVRLLQRAGSRWAAFASTLSMNAATPARSAGSSVSLLTA
jgi:hypothetical protein